jgi:hypothetical protein
VITDDLPDPCKLTVEDLRLVRDLFSDNAINAAHKGDDVMAALARTICDRYSFELNCRARDRRELQQAITEYRLRHPYGVIRTTSDE